MAEVYKISTGFWTAGKDTHNVEDFGPIVLFVSLVAQTENPGRPSFGEPGLNPSVIGLDRDSRVR